MRPEERPTKNKRRNLFEYNPGLGFTTNALEISVMMLKFPVIPLQNLRGQYWGQ